MVLKLNKEGICKTGESAGEVLLALAGQHCRALTGAVTPLTNNSGGTAGHIKKVATLATSANASTNLADVTTTEAALTTVHNAIRELYAKANATAAVLGVDQITYSGGGASPDGTIAAVTVSVTAASTGAQASVNTAVIDKFNNAFYNAAVLVNKLNAACGLPLLTDEIKGTPATTIAAITVSAGTAASPGVTKVDMDAALSKFRDNVKTLASALITLNTATTPAVRPV